MPFSEKLLQKLGCPKCRGPLEYDEQNDRLICQACRVAYPVRDNIPVLLIDEAKKL